MWSPFGRAVIFIPVSLDMGIFCIELTRKTEIFYSLKINNAFFDLV